MSERIKAFVESMRIQPEDRVLEIGCGHGVAASLIASQLSGGSYLAIDRSQKMIAAAIKRNAAFIKSGIARFLKVDLESADFGNEKFDKILAMRIRIFRMEPERARKLVQSWLTPKGTLFVQYDEPQNRTKGHASRLTVQPHFHTEGVIKSSPQAGSEA